MIFLDASFLISYLYISDSNYARAVKIMEANKEKEFCTSYAVLGEVLTVGSMRYDRNHAIAFVEHLLQTDVKILYETPQSLHKTFEFFKNRTKKDISWVDCLSCVLMKEHHIKEMMTFDKDLSALIESVK